MLLWILLFLLTRIHIYSSFTVRGHVSSDHPVWDSVELFRASNHRTLIGDDQDEPTDSSATNTEQQPSPTDPTSNADQPVDLLLGADDSEAKLSASLADVTLNSNTDKGEGKEECDVSVFPTLHNNTRFISAGGYPQYTNYTGGFKDLLDYIFIETEYLHAVHVAPFPTVEVLSEHTALPSVVFPSDHLAVAVDVRLG